MDLKKTKTATKKQWTSKLFSLSSGCEQLLFNSQSRTFRILFALPGLGLRLGIQEWAGGCFAWTRRLACPGLHARSRPTLLCGAIECLPGVPVERACLTAPPRAKHVPRPAANFLFTQIPFLATHSPPRHDFANGSWPARLLVGQRDTANHPGSASFLWSRGHLPRELGPALLPQLCPAPALELPPFPEKLLFFYEPQTVLNPSRGCSVQLEIRLPSFKS